MEKESKKFNRTLLVGGLLLASQCVLPALASDIKFSGFLQVGGGFVDDKNGPPYMGYDEEDITFDHNLVGIQATGTVADKLTATVQLVARGEKDYQVKSEWAYISYQVSDSSKIRAGRLRTPFYMYSDFLDVGYAYAWISPPREVYYLPFNNIDGVDYYKTGQLGVLDTSFQAYLGTFNDELDLNGSGVLSSAKTRNQMGLAGTLGKDWWTLRAAYHKADLSVDVRNIPISSTATMGSLAKTLTTFGYTKNANNLLVEEDNASFAEVGLTIDTGTFIAAAEHVEFKPEDSLLSKNIREFAMVGFRKGKILIHLTAQKADDEIAHPEAGIATGVALPVVGSSNVLIGTLQAVAQTQVVSRDVLGVGVRWDLTNNAALKFQVDRIDDDAKGKQKVFAVALQSVF